MDDSINKDHQSMYKKGGKTHQSIFLTMQHMGEEGLNYFFAALALLSTIIGGGISGLPYSFFQTGFTLGIIFNIFMCFQCGLSCYLYF